MEARKVQKGDRIKVVLKTDPFSQDYEVGEEFTVLDTWYDGVQVVSKFGIPLSLSKEEYRVQDVQQVEVHTAAQSDSDIMLHTEGAAGGTDLSPVRNIRSLPEEYLMHSNAGLVTGLLSDAAGGRKLCVREDVVPPAALSTKYHSHSSQEEFFLILEGKGTLRFNGQEYPVVKGSFISKPAGQGDTHTFINTGEEPLHILDIASEQEEDTCYYPEEDVYFHKAGQQRSIYRGGGIVTDWDSDPNNTETKA